MMEITLFQQCFDEEYYCEGEGEDVKPVFDVSDEEMGKYYGFYATPASAMRWHIAIHLCVCVCVL
jgi:elongation factor P hydroxylase